jgi:hypothetical protein
MISIEYDLKCAETVATLRRSALVEYDVRI